MEAKGFAVGVRLEHPQELIDRIQYHNSEGRGKYLPAAEYSFVTQINGRGVYSFCMCPGGFIVPAASGPNQLVVNGMSPSNRGSRWANSGMVVEIRPEDIPGYEVHDVLAGIKFQEEIEYQCFINGNCRQTAPAQRMTDFINGKISPDIVYTRSNIFSFTLLDALTYYRAASTRISPFRENISWLSYSRSPHDRCRNPHLLSRTYTQRQ